MVNGTNELGQDCRVVFLFAFCTEGSKCMQTMIEVRLISRYKSNTTIASEYTPPDLLSYILLYLDLIQYTRCDYTSDLFISKKYNRTLAGYSPTDKMMFETHALFYFLEK